MYTTTSAEKILWELRKFRGSLRHFLRTQPHAVLMLESMQLVHEKSIKCVLSKWTGLLFTKYFSYWSYVFMACLFAETWLLGNSLYIEIEKTSYSQILNYIFAHKCRQLHFIRLNIYCLKEIYDVIRKKGIGLNKFQLFKSSERWLNFLGKIALYDKKTHTKFIPIFEGHMKNTKYSFKHKK